MSTDYWSLDAALAEETLVPARFVHGLQSVARVLEPGSSSNDIEQGAKVETPLWLAAAMTARSLATLGLPEMYQERYRRKLNAGAECVNFKGRAPFFYDVGNKCNQFLQDPGLSGFLARTYATRYRELVSKGLSTVSGEEMLELQSKLSLEELSIFEAGRNSVGRSEMWMRGVRPRASLAPQNSRKRPGSSRDGSEPPREPRQRAEGT
jgi:GINS complex subunit 3